jgi:CHAD domain-containing protein
VAEPAPLNNSRISTRPRSSRPLLRLVRSSSEELGPISPELVLVDPGLADAVRVKPDAVVVGGPRARPIAENNVGPQWQPPTAPACDGGSATVRYDTRDLLLERHGLTLELSDRTWRLTAARGESIEATADGMGVPHTVEALLRTVIRGGELVQVPLRSTDPQIRRLEEQVAKQHHSLVRHDVGTRIASDPESLHQLRVAARRVRAFLAVAHDLVDREWANEINEGMRDLGRASNDARDVDILLGNLRTELACLDVRDQVAGAALIRRLEDDRRELQGKLVGLLDSGAYQRVLDQLALPATPATSAPAPKLDRLAKRELRRLVARVRRLGKRPSDDALHALRIKVKRVRYATELAGAPAGKRTARVIAAATRMQDVLGAHQDAVVGEERLRLLAHSIDETGVAFVAGRLAEREGLKRAEIDDRLAPAWKKLHKVARKLDR